MLVTVELLELWLLDPSAPSTLAVDPLDVAIFVQKRTHGLVGRAKGSQLAALPELFSILGHTYYSQNYSGIITVLVEIIRDSKNNFFFRDRGLLKLLWSKFQDRELLGSRIIRHVRIRIRVARKSSRDLY